LLEQNSKLEEEEKGEDEEDDNLKRILSTEENMFSARSMRDFPGVKSGVAILMNDNLKEILKFFYQSTKGSSIQDLLKLD
jgi:hypothetical protein